MATTWLRRVNGKRVLANLLIAVLPSLVFFTILEGVARLFYTPRSHLPATLFRYDPETWYGLTPSFSGDYADHAVHTNSYGYRSPQIPVEKPAGALRIVVVGDSISFGHGVDQEQAYPALLEAALRERLHRPVDVVNTAVPGNSPYQEYVDLVRAMKFRPDAVIYQFTLNDVVEPFWGRRTFGGGGIDYHGIADVPYVDYVMSQHSALYLFLKDLATRWRFGLDSHAQIARVAAQEERYRVEALVEQPLSAELRDAWRIAFGDIEKMKAVCDEARIPFVILASPVDFQMTESRDQALPQRMLEAFSVEHGITFVDTLAVVENIAVQRSSASAAASPADIWNAYFIDYDHPSPLGHSLIANLLTDTLVRSLGQP